MSSEDYASKAEEMRRRAAEASTESLKALYLRGADSYEALAKRPSVLGLGGAGGSDNEARQAIETLRDEMRELKQQIFALDNSLTITLTLLRRHMPALATSLAQINVEPHPDTPPEQKEALSLLAARVRRILGQRPPPEPEAPGDGPHEEGAPAQAEAPEQRSFAPPE
jgi:hypothetical protein